ncbi:MAG: LamG domain-containing protein, partial [Planctomycetota bacterium]
YLGPGLGEGTMHMNGGTVNVGGHMEVGAWEENLGTLNMTDGVINITQGLYCPHAWDGTGRVNLWGGTINARYIFMNDAIRTTGLIDIAGGKFILSRGNEVEELTDYSNGIGTIGDGAVLLTAYGVGDGDIITYDANYPDVNGKRADLSIDYDVSNEGKTTVQAFTTDPNQAWNPSPPNGAGNVKGTVANISRPVLSWSAGDGATSHEVYFDTNEALVSARDVSVRKQTAYSPSSWTVDSDLISFQTYYWAIDENPGPISGQVWDFTMANLAKAGSFSPENGVTNVNPTVVLSWASGIYADEHHVYFSTDFNDVNNRNPAVRTILPLLTQEYDPALDYGTQYYWAVDEVNGLDTWPSEVLTFTIANHLIIDDFDSYASDEELVGDGVSIPPVWHDYWSIDTEAELFLNTNADFAIDGNSIQFLYDNDTSGSKNKYSWVEAFASDLQAGTDWTVSTTKALVLYFRGVASNSAQPLYVVIEDGDANEAMATYDDANGTQEEFWHEWNIDLEDFNGAGVDLTDVYKIHLGIGVRGETAISGGTGEVYFDDFALWPTRCVGAYSYGFGDVTGDCFVDEWDLGMMVGEWLAQDGSVEATAPSDVNLVARWEFENNYDDSNGSNHGVPYDNVDTVYDAGGNGKLPGYVLECDGDGDYVEIPGSNTPGGVFDITGDITVSAWIKFDVLANNWPAIIAKGDDTESWRLARSGTPGTGDTIEFCASGVILYYDYGELNPYGNVTGSVPVADGQWHHVTGVYDGSTICLYVDGIVDTCLEASGPF